MPVSVGACWGKLGSLLTGNFKRYLEGSRKRASLFAGALLGGLLPGDPEGYGEEGSGDGHHPMGKGRARTQTPFYSSKRSVTVLLMETCRTCTCNLEW